MAQEAFLGRRVVVVVVVVVWPGNSHVCRVHSKARNDNMETSKMESLRKIKRNRIARKTPSTPPSEAGVGSETAGAEEMAVVVAETARATVGETEAAKRARVATEGFSADWKEMAGQSAEAVPGEEGGCVDAGPRIAVATAGPKAVERRG